MVVMKKQLIQVKRSIKFILDSIECLYKNREQVKTPVPC